MPLACLPYFAEDKHPEVQDAVLESQAWDDLDEEDDGQEEDEEEEGVGTG